MYDITVSKIKLTLKFMDLSRPIRISLSTYRCQLGDPLGFYEINVANELNLSFF